MKSMASASESTTLIDIMRSPYSVSQSSAVAGTASVRAQTLSSPLTSTLFAS